MKLTKIPHARQGTRGGGEAAWKFNFPEIDTLFVINQVFRNVLHSRFLGQPNQVLASLRTENMNTISTKFSTYSNSMFCMSSYLDFDLQSI